MKRMIIASLPIALAAALPATAGASVRSCPGNPQGAGYGPRCDRSAPNQVSSVRNISCRAAASGVVEHGSLSSRGNLRAPGWHCVVLKRYHTGSLLMGANVRCARRSQAFRWNWAT
jgi:hypothetical protein